MKDRHVLLKSWLYVVMEENGNMEKGHVVKALEKDMTLLNESLKKELALLKGGKLDGR